jgi:hypothetical protein
MRFGRRRSDRGTGRLDGGAGTGVRLGGSDTGQRPTGYRRQNDAFDDDETAIDESQVSVNDYSHLAEDGEDDNPGDRRRDPLRH